MFFYEQITEKGMKFNMINWEEYYKVHTDDEIEPNRLLKKVIDKPNNIKSAIDLGSGAGTDTISLLEKGINVYSIDKEASSSRIINQRLKNLNKENLKTNLMCITDNFETINLPKVDLINCYNSLSYCNPSHFYKFIDNIKSSINKGGTFAANFFGVEDSWYGKENMTFLTKQNVLDLFHDFNIIEINETKKKGVTSLKKEKFWHFIDIIATKY